MKQKFFIQPILLGGGVGAAMSVALQDNAVGWAIGIAVAVAFTVMRRNDKPENK